MSLNTAFRPMGSDFFGHTFQVSCGYLKNCVLVCLDRNRKTNKQTKSGARFLKNVSSGL